MATLNYNHLRYFWAVAREGGLIRAAERLNVSQSALSLQIRKLEARLGHDLFERRGRRLELTEAGRIAFEHAEAIFSAGRELQDRLAAREPGRRQVLRVGALATLSRNFQLRFLRPVLGREDVEVVLRSGALRDLLAALEAHRLDVALVNAAPPRDAATLWTSHALGEQPVSLIAAPGRLRDGEAPEALAAREALVLPTPESAIRAGFDAWADRAGLAPRIAAEADDMAMLRLLARADAGVTLAPPIVVRDELASGRLREAHRFDGLVEPFHAIVPTRRFPNALLRELLDAAALWDGVDEGPAA
ncbi:MAG: LysR family transcriptional regulator [Pseudomonadota bacterium]